MPIAIIVHAKYPEELDRFRVRACRLAPLTLPQEPGPDHLHLSATVTSNILSTRSDVAPLPQCLRETEPPRRDRPMRTFIRLILLVCPVTMLYPQTPTQQPKFALEISEDGPPLHYELVPQGQLVRSESLSFAPGPYLHLRSGRTTADAKKNLTSAIMLAYHVDGDAVAISASVVFGAVDNNSGSCPMAAGHQIGRAHV